MESSTNTSEAASVTQRRVVVGPLVLIAMFSVSAGLTAFYLSTTTSSSAVSQSAAVANVATPFDGITLEAESAYVLDLATGHVLYQRNATTQLPLASLTKVSMALAVSEVLPHDSILTIPYDTAPRGSAERLGRGEAWSVQSVVNFTLIASSNGGADILAAAADEGLRARHPAAPAGSATLWRMNDIARSLGLTNTYFLNVNGLDISTTQAGAYGSAKDMAALFSYAASHDAGTFAGTARGGMLLTSISGTQTSAFNTNLALGSIPGLIMGKTGFTDLAGGNLAIVFDVGPAHPVVAVVLHSSETGRFEDMKKLVAATLTAVSEGL